MVRKLLNTASDEYQNSMGLYTELKNSSTKLLEMNMEMYQQEQEKKAQIEAEQRQYQMSIETEQRQNQMNRDNMLTSFNFIH
jgi:hypothetical protein